MPLRIALGKTLAPSGFYVSYRRSANKLLENYIILKYGTLKMGAPPDPKLCPVALFLKQVKKGQAGTHGVRARGGLGGNVSPEPPIIRFRPGFGALCPTPRGGSANGALAAGPQRPHQTY